MRTKRGNEAGCEGARRPVSRVLSMPIKASPDLQGTVIPLGHALLRASRDQPGRRGERPLAHPSGMTPRDTTRRPYSVLLPVGFALPPPLPEARCALTAPFHPCPQAAPVARKRVRAVCFLWHFPWGRPRRPLTGTVPSWSPDFPPPHHPNRRCGADLAAATVRPSGERKLTPDRSCVKAGRQGGGVKAGRQAGLRQAGEDRPGLPGSPCSLRLQALWHFLGSGIS